MHPPPHTNVLNPLLLCGCLSADAHARKHGEQHGAIVNATAAAAHEQQAPAARPGTRGRGGR